MKSAAKRQSLDMLHGTIWDKIPKFALPVAATAILGQLFNAADVAVVGNFTGDLKTQCVAAVGTNSSVVSLIVNLFVGIALGANVTIAQAIGKGDEKAVHKAVHTAVLLSILLGIAAMLLSEAIAAPLLKSMQVPDDVYPLALLYLRIYLLGLPVILLYNFEAAIFRSVGETKVPLIALVISGVLNVILNLFFVIVLHMTVDGVAVATVISNAVSAVVLWIYLLKSDKVIRLHPRDLAIDKASLRRIIKIGLPAGLQSSVFSIANIMIQGAVNSLGTVVMAASGAAMNIEIMVYYIVNAFSQACTTFVGQNFGAGEIDRCKKTLHLCIAEGSAALVIAVALGLIFGRQMLAVFNSDPEVISIGYIRLAVLMSSDIFSLFYESLSGYLRGFGISLVPAILTVVGVCGIRFTWVYLIFPHYKTFLNIMLVYPVSLSATALLLLIAVLHYKPSKHFSYMSKPAAEDY